MKSYFNPAFVLRFCIAIAYIILGIVLMALPMQLALLKGTTKILFATLLMAYGLFRLYRAFHTLKESE